LPRRRSATQEGKTGEFRTLGKRYRGKEGGLAGWEAVWEWGEIMFSGSWLGKDKKILKGKGTTAHASRRPQKVSRKTITRGGGGKQGSC